jgi:hypothetical protein
MINIDGAEIHSVHIHGPNDIYVMYTLPYSDEFHRLELDANQAKAMSWVLNRILINRINPFGEREGGEDYEY